MRSFEGFETLCLVSIYVHTLSLPSYLLTWGLNIKREKALGRKKRKAYLHPKTCLFSIFLTGASIQGRSQIWMDANGGEVTLWQQMLERPNFWVEGSVPLRTSDKLQGGSAWRLEKTNKKKLNHKTYTYIYQLVSYYLLIWLHYHQQTTKPNSVIHYSSLSFLIHDTMYFVSLFSVSLTMINKWIHSENHLGSALLDIYF